MHRSESSFCPRRSCPADRRIGDAMNAATVSAEIGSLSAAIWNGSSDWGIPGRDRRIRRGCCLVVLSRRPVAQPTVRLDRRGGPQSGAAPVGMKPSGSRGAPSADRNRPALCGYLTARQLPSARTHLSVSPVKIPGRSVACRRHPPSVSSRASGSILCVPYGAGSAYMAAARANAPQLRQSAIRYDPPMPLAAGCRSGSAVSIADTKTAGCESRPSCRMPGRAAIRTTR